MFRAAQDCFSDFINGFTFNEIDMFDFHRISSTALETLSKEMDRSDKVSENLKEKMHTLEMERRRRSLRHASGEGAARAVQAAHDAQAARDTRDDYTERTA